MDNIKNIIYIPKNNKLESEKDLTFIKLILYL